MYPFYNPQFIKFEHQERLAEAQAATRRARPPRRPAWLRDRPLVAFPPFQRKHARSASAAR
jgi:hypothetical protein